MEELKCCPFCGAKPNVSFGRDGECYINCLRCGSSHVCDWTEKEAAERWNKRIDYMRAEK